MTSPLTYARTEYAKRWHPSSIPHRACLRGWFDTAPPLAAMIRDAEEQALRNRTEAGE